MQSRKMALTARCESGNAKSKNETSNKRKAKKGRLKGGEKDNKRRKD
jgi:hypothetical protein